MLALEFYCADGRGLIKSVSLVYLVLTMGWLRSVFLPMFARLMIEGISSAVFPVRP